MGSPDVKRRRWPAATWLLVAAAVCLVGVGLIAGTATVECSAIPGSCPGVGNLVSQIVIAAVVVVAVVGFAVMAIRTRR